MDHKADANGPFKEFVFEDWVREGVRGMYGEPKKERFSRSKFRSHMRKVYREKLVAVRDLIDKAINYVDRQEAQTREA
jgi:hypothetical protein